MKAQVVSFHCVLKNGLGQLISTSFNRDVITTDVSGTAETLPGLAAGLQDVKPGERRKISVGAQAAYGLYDPELTRQASRRRLESSGDLAVDDRIHLEDRHGEFRLYRVTKILGDVVYLDANHPLAGQDLTFEVHVMDARDATAEELRESGSPAPKQYLQ